MAYWLFKTEPGDYSFDDLIKEGKTVWDGVTNNWALKFLRTINIHDQAFIYHTGKEKCVVGIAEITSDPYPDPQKSNDKLMVVNVKPLRKLSGEVTLNMLKKDPFFSELLLVKFSRLSVMPVEEKYWIRILELD
jgi:predicted RNA-binding protein with PUA-like domain